MSGGLDINESDTSKSYILRTRRGNNYGLFVSTTGNVGIGTTEPSEELHVIGDIKASGEITGSNIGSDGFSCPSGMVKVGSFCIDKYEASVWSSPTGGTQYGASSDNYPCNDNGNDCGKNASNPIYARSIPGVTPSRYITWFQAAQACANVGKRLCTNMEWQIAASGTPDNETDCNINTSGVEDTDARPNCVSSWGVYNMVGNLWEWVADWYVAGTNYTNSGSDGTSYTPWPAGYGDDATWNVGGRAYNGSAWVNGAPAAALRGGDWATSTSAGVFAFFVSYAPSKGSSAIGFRCCK